MTESTAAIGSTLPRRRRGLLFLAPVLLLLLAWGVPAYLHSNRKPKPVEPVSASVDGAALFARHCAYCHGAHGDGRGSVVLQPPARYFGRDKFKFATTLNGVPTDDDLLRILDRGIPGSAMPSFAHLTREEKLACVQQVRRFTRQGLFDVQVQKALKNEDDPEPEKFARVAAQLSEPGKPLEIPAIPPSTPVAVGRGKLVYAKVCAACHGPEGKGDGPQVKDLKNDDGTPNVPRDLTLGQYKAGGEPAELYARIVLGIPGTPMPASDKLTPAEIFDLIHFLRSLPAR